jgi:hypothetical protein
MPRYTETEQKIVDSLSDGYPHSKQDLRQYLPDEIGAAEGRSNLNQHISNIRKKMRPTGRDILCVRARGQVCYRQVLLIQTGE